MSRSRVALVRGENRYHNIRQALELLTDGVGKGPAQALCGKQRVLVKPNFVVTHMPLAATHTDAMRAVLDFVREHYDGPVTIAGGPSTQPAAEAFQRYGYRALAKAYDASLLDLNLDKPFPVKVYDHGLRPLRLDVARSVVDSDFRISVGPPKTHDVVMVTLSLKNMIMGALISRHTHTHSTPSGKGPLLGAVKRMLWRSVPLWMRRLPPVEWLRFRAMSTLEPSDKMRMHQSYPVINLNLALLAPLVVPHLSVIDGFEAMEGNGPTNGTPVPLHLALASADALAADTVGTALMGFEVDQIGYLHYCKRMNLGTGDLERIDLVGNADLADCVRPFRPHDAIDRQRRWQLPQADRYLCPEEAGTWSGRSVPRPI
ncbi:MAG: DUF362 domain-containing protein [Anaerolineae bacterium]